MNKLNLGQEYKFSEGVCGEFQFMQQWVSENDLCNEIATNNF